MRSKTYSIIALVCSIWFVLLGWMWAYFFNIVFVFPIAVLGFVFWRKSKTEAKNSVYSITGILFLIGAVSSVLALLLFR